MSAALRNLKWKIDEPHPSSLFWIPLCAELVGLPQKIFRWHLDLFGALTATGNQIKFNSGSWNITPLVCLTQDIKLWGLQGWQIAELAVSVNWDHLDIPVYITWKQAKLVKEAWKCASALSFLLRKIKPDVHFITFKYEVHGWLRSKAATILAKSLLRMCRVFFLFQKAPNTLMRWLSKGEQQPHHCIAQQLVLDCSQGKYTIFHGHQARTPPQAHLKRPPVIIKQDFSRGAICATTESNSKVSGAGHNRVLPSDTSFVPSLGSLILTQFPVLLIVNISAHTSQHQRGIHVEQREIFLLASISFQMIILIPAKFISYFNLRGEKKKQPPNPTNPKIPTTLWFKPLLLDKQQLDWWQQSDCAAGIKEQSANADS